MVFLFCFILTNNVTLVFTRSQPTKKVIRNIRGKFDAYRNLIQSITFIGTIYMTLSPLHLHTTLFAHYL